MHIPDHVREGLEIRFLQALDETKAPDTGYIQKSKAMKYAMGLVGRDAPHLYFESCQLGVEALMETIAQSYFTKTRQRLQSGQREFGRDLSLRQMLEGFSGEIVSFPVKGQRENLRKFVKDCTPSELKLVFESYKRRAAENTSYHVRYEALYEKAKAAGVADDQPIGNLIAEAI